MSRKLRIELVGSYSPRLTRRVRLGLRLHPQSVTDAWYEADCPERFDPRPHVSRLDFFRWRIACRLRRARRA